MGPKFFMEMISVSSSWIAAVGYRAGTLRVVLREGRTYDHYSVPQYVFEALVSACSVGTYYNQNIRGRYH